MWFDKLSFFQKTQLKIAKSVAPVKPKKTVTFNEIDFALSTPILYSQPEVIFSKPTITNNYCYTDTSVTVVSSEVSKDYAGATNKLLTVVFTTPEILDLGSIEDLLAQYPVIETFPMKFHKPFIKGKNYSRNGPPETSPEKIRKERKSKTSIASEEKGKEEMATGKIEIHYKEENKFDLFDIFDLIFPALQPPIGKHFDNPIVFPQPLLAFQPEGIEFLLSKPQALLGDEMGLGKTIQTIVALKVLFSTGKITTCCIVCPKALITNWYHELLKWAPELKSLKLDGGKEQRRILWHTGAHIYICVYESLQKDLEKTVEMRGLTIDAEGHHFKCPNVLCAKELVIPFILHYTEVECHHCNTKFFYPYKDDRARTHFDVIVFDEIQKTKNPKTKMTRATRLLYAEYKWALSGTPMENKLKDLVTICETISPELFKEANKRVAQDVINTYKNIFIRRKKDDVLKYLAPIQSKYEWLELSPSQRKKYDHAEATGMIDLEGKGNDVTVHHIFALITKLKQLCNYDPETKESSKLDYLKEKLEELTSQGDKAIVFSQFPNKTLVPLLDHLHEYNPLYYHGGLSSKEREVLIRKFQDPDNKENMVMLISLKSGNAGITLTRANYVFHFDLWWNPAISSQAAGRAHRIGQEKVVFETMLLAEDTIERRIFNILETKKTLFAAVVDDLSEEINIDKLMSEEEIFGLFGLTKRRANTFAVVTDAVRTDYQNMNDEEFETFVADLFEIMGYHIKETKQNKQQNGDIYGKIITPHGIKEAIIKSIKVTNTHTEVELEVLQKLLILFNLNKKLSKAYLVTNGKYNFEAQKFAEANNIELVDGAKLQNYVHIHFSK